MEPSRQPPCRRAEAYNDQPQPIQLDAPDPALDSGRRLRGRVGGASTTTSRRLATATTSKGRCSGRSATTAPAASIRRASLKAGIVAPSVMLRKLAAYRRQNQLDLALQELGRIERTLVMLDWRESPEFAPTLRCRAQQQHAASFPRAGHLHLQTRPANKAGLPTAVPRRSSFAPPASTSSSPRSCSGTPSTSPTPSPISVRLNNRCPMHGSPINRRSAGSTRASPAMSCGSGPPRPQISAARSISADAGRCTTRDFLSPFGRSVV